MLNVEWGCSRAARVVNGNPNGVFACGERRERGMVRPPATPYPRSAWHSLVRIQHSTFNIQHSTFNIPAPRAIKEKPRFPGAFRHFVTRHFRTSRSRGSRSSFHRTSARRTQTRPGERPQQGSGSDRAGRYASSRLPAPQRAVRRES